MVRNLCNNSKRFVVNDDGTAYDHTIRVSWIIAPHKLPGNDNKMEWEKAVLFCDNLDYNGHSDWRLPNCEEFTSMICENENFIGLPFDHPFIDIKLDFYWSGTELSRMPEFAWRIPLMNEMFVGRSWKTNEHYVWPIRSLELKGL